MSAVYGRDLLQRCIKQPLNELSRTSTSPSSSCKKKRTKANKAFVSNKPYFYLIFFLIKHPPNRFDTNLCNKLETCTVSHIRFWKHPFSPNNPFRKQLHIHETTLPKTQTSWKQLIPVEINLKTDISVHQCKFRHNLQFSGLFCHERMVLLTK